MVAESVCVAGGMDGSDWRLWLRCINNFGQLAESLIAGGMTGTDWMLWVGKVYA